MESKRHLSHLAVLAALAAMLAAPVWAAAAEAEAPAKTEPPAAAEGEKKPAETVTTNTGPEGQRCSAFESFIQESKKPLPWLTWGADLRLREVYVGNGITLNEDAANHELHFQRYRGRWWFTATPVKDVAINSRIMWEGRHWNKPDAFPEWGNGWRGDVMFDTLNLELKKIGGSPVSLKVGRQDIILGDGWLVLDGTPLDGSRTLYFDAARMTVDLDAAKTKVDLIYIDMDADPDDAWIGLIKDRGANAMGAVTDQDERGVILYVTNNSIEKTQIEGYFMMKEEQMLRFLPNGRQGELYTFGGALSGTPGDHWKYRVEGAHQFGHEMGRNVRAFAYNSSLSYLVKDKINSQVRGMYEFVSGDDPSTQGTDESFDMLWGRWPRWSELYIYTYNGETGRIAENNNLHRLGFGYTCDPAKDLQFCAHYHLLWAHQNTFAGRAGFSDSGNFRGQLLTLLTKYKFNDHVSTHVITEFVFPGNYQDDTRNDPACFLRGELVFTW